MLWEHEPQASVSTAFSRREKNHSFFVEGEKPEHSKQGENHEQTRPTYGPEPESNPGHIGVSPPPSLVCVSTLRLDLKLKFFHFSSPFTE